MPGDLIEAAAIQEAENVRLESSAVVAEEAAETAVLAAEQVILMANIQAANVTQEAAETIREAEATIQILEGSLEWVAQNQTQMLEANQRDSTAIWQALSEIREAIAELMLLKVSTESPLLTPPSSEVVTEAIVTQTQTTEPQNADVAGQKAAETPEVAQRKKTRRFL